MMLMVGRTRVRANMVVDYEFDGVDEIEGKEWKRQKIENDRNRVASASFRVKS